MDFTEVFTPGTQGYTEATPEKPFVERIQATLYKSIGSVGLIGNLFVLIVICSSKPMRRKFNNKLLINQSMIDSLVSVFLIAQADTQLSIDPEMVDVNRISAELYCRIWLAKTFMWVFLISSTYNLLVVTLDRYLEIVHPISYKTRVGKKIRVTLLAFPWIFGFVFEGLFMTNASGLVGDVCMLVSIYSSFTALRATLIFVVIMQFYLPLTVMIFCYASMIRALRGRVAHKDVSLSAAESARQQRMERVTRNILKTLILVTLCFFFCWVWNETCALLFAITTKATYLFGPFYHFTVYAVFVNCCLNPVVYSVQYRQFQEAALRLINIRRGRLGDDESKIQTSQTGS